MDGSEELEKKISELAGKVVSNAHNVLLVDLRFLDAAIGFLKISEDGETETIRTDGERLLYNPRFVLREYREEKSEAVRIYLHTLLHCIMRHMFVHSLVNRRCWDLACDMAAENMINELGIKSVTTKRVAAEETELRYVKRETKLLTAERIYRFLMDGNVSEREMDEWASLFRSDDHSKWYSPVSPKEKDGDDDGDKNGSAGWQERQMPGQNSDSENGMNGESGRSGRSDAGKGDRPSDEALGDSEGDSGETMKAIAGSSDAEQQWKEISESIEEDVETFSRNIGESAGSLIKNLEEINRKKYDYADFLRKFSVRGETIKVNSDEFDYIFYTYGLKLYRNIPLVEPLEYRDEKKIREFVIAIDTSGSTYGSLVQKFLERTYGILSESESFFSKINVHIIQCDSSVQHDEKIKSREEFDRYIKDLRIYGGGGTDFRPVFRHVDELIKNHEFRNLKGVIYFTDGIGIYPEKKPDYDAAFVFIGDRETDPAVPPWAIKLVLRDDEI